MDGADGEQHRQRRALGAGPCVGEQQHSAPGPDGRLGLGDDPVERTHEPLVRLEGDVETLRVEALDPVREEQEARELDAGRRFRALDEDRRAIAEQRPEREDEPLAEVVDRRVRDLCEALAEERVQRTCAARERRQRSVVAHRRGRLVRVRGGRAENRPQVLLRVAEGGVPRRQVVLGRVAGRAARAADEAALEPFAVRGAGGQPPLEPDVLLESAPRIDRDHLARSQPASAHRPVRQVGDARLRRTDDEIAADGVAQRAQAVAVERRAHDPAVREHERRGTVPRLAEPRVVAVEVANGRLELGVSLPGLGNEHGQRVPNVPAAADEQLEDVVQHRRVRAARVDHGREQGVVVRAEPALARVHPVHVPLDRVDLAVVAEQAERLRTLPRRRRVGREPLVEDAERHRDRRVAQVAVERRQLIGGAESLVRDRSEGERGDVGSDGALRTLAGTEGPALRLGRFEPGRGEQELLDPRQARLSLGAEGVRIDRHLTPPEHLQALLPARGFERLAVGVVPEEDHAEPAARGREQCGRDRQQQSGAVARLSIGGDRAAVLDAAERLEQRVQDLPRGTAARVRDEADATGIELGGRVVQRRCVRHEAPLGRDTDSGARPPPVV